MAKSTFDKFFEDYPEEKETFEKEKFQLVVQEIILALMEEDEKSVRRLAEYVGLSPSVIQGLRSGTGHDTGFSKVAKIIHALGAEIVIRKDNKDLAVI